MPKASKAQAAQAVGKRKETKLSAGFFSKLWHGRRLEEEEEGEEQEEGEQQVTPNPNANPNPNPNPNPKKALISTRARALS